MASQRDKLVQQFVKQARGPVASINRPHQTKIPSDPGMRAQYNKRHPGLQSPAMTQRKRPSGSSNRSFMGRRWS